MPDPYEPLVAVAREVSFIKGAELVRQGEASRGAFVIRSGAAEARIKLPGGGTLAVAKFRDGDMFGEMALVERGVVSATVVAESNVDAWFVGRDDFRALVASREAAALDVQRAITRSLSDKLRAATGIKIGGQSLGFSTYNEGRLFGYMLGLKEPLFIAAFGGAELDPALMRGEIDGRATGPDTILQRNRDWIDKGLANIHAIMETPKGDKHTHPFFAKLPEIETFAKNDRERKMLALQRGFRVTGTPFVLPPGTPKDRVDILKEAFRKTYLDPEFAKYYHKLTADEPTPLLPENHEKAIRDVPRDPEAIELFKIIAGPKKLPAR